MKVQGDTNAPWTCIESGQLLVTEGLLSKVKSEESS